MNYYYKTFFYLVIVCLLCSLLLFNISCASSKTNKFHTKIQGMSDNDLLNYYHGINDRIKEIDRGIKREENSDQNEQGQVISEMPFLIGGEGHSLNQKSKMILKELKIRGVTP